MNNIYVRFTVVSFAFLTANTIAFSLGLVYLANSASLLSLGGFLAVAGVILSNCSAVQQLLAGKHHIQSLFVLGIVPSVGFLIAFLLLKHTSMTTLAMIIYSFSLLLGVLLLAFTLYRLNKQSQKKSTPFYF